MATAQNYLLAYGAPLTALAYGLFGGGFPSTGSNAVASGDRYHYNTAALLSGVTLSTAKAAYGAAGNYTKGVFSGGSTTNSLAVSMVATTDIFTYSSAVASSGGSLGAAQTEAAGFGNSTTGIFAGGYNGSSASTAINKYTYSSDATAVSSAVLTAASQWPCGAGNDAQAMIGGINGGAATTNIYTYSSDAIVAGVNLGSPRWKAAAVSYSSRGALMAGGINGSTTLAYVDVYIFSSSTDLVGTALSTARNAIAGAGNAGVGVFGGGINTAGTVIATTDVYTFASQGVAAGTALANARNTFSATSSAPGGF